MKKVIVTGALGFIGHHLCVKLLEEGVEVIGIDHIPACRNRNIAKFKLDLIGRNSMFQFIDEPVETVDFSKITKDVQVLFHLAANTEEDTWEDVENKISQNVEMTKTIAKQCPKGLRFIYASTVQVYGARIGEITEDAPKNPASYYGLTKLIAEKILFNEQKEKGFEVVVLRLPVVYGPWQRENLAYQKLIQATVKPKQHEIPTDPITIDTVYVSDVIDIMLKAAISPQAKNEIFNIGSGREGEWIKGLELIYGKGLEEKKDELLSTVVSITKAKNVLKYSPSVMLKQGIRFQEDQTKQWLSISKDLS